MPDCREALSPALGRCHAKRKLVFGGFGSRPCRTNETRENNTTFPIPSSMVLMVIPHLVRLGPFGHVGRFLPVEAAQYPRGSRVVCRTRRGLEVGQVLAADEPPSRPYSSTAPRSSSGSAADGELLRKVTVEDDLLLARIERRKHEAFEVCNKLLAERGIAAALMDVEHLFDGQSLYFYFLGSPPAEAELLTAELAAAYDSAVEFQKFTDAVELGCGPQCGTEEATGCGTDGGHAGGGCSSCSIAAACVKH